MTPLVVITGTGTDVGKTHFATALVQAWAKAGPCPIAGIKPVETGVEGAAPDGSRLAQVSTFHVKRYPPPYLFVRPVSPHLAAREADVAIDLDVVLSWVSRFRAEAGAVVMELAGGLFTPLSTSRTNADLVRGLPGARTILVAPDRLGVLHDVLCAGTAAKAIGVALDGVVLSTPERPDAATGTNAAELRALTGLPVLAELGRASAEALSEHPALRALVGRLSVPPP